MVSRHIVVLVALGFASSAACGDDNTKGGNVGAIDVAGLEGIGGGEGLSDDDSGPDGVGDGLAGDPGPSDTGGADVPPQPGEFGYPCDDNSQCYSQFCVEGVDDDVCTKTCVEECPGGWSCKAVASGADVTYICVVDYVALCRPCQSDGDCNQGGGNDVVKCLDYGDDGTFCGGDCSDKACPDGYSCSDVDDGLGGTTPQCVLDAGICECKPKFVGKGYLATCGLNNEFGTCTGTRQCTTQGLSACDAKAATAELCDLVDNDCDGVIDENAQAEPCETTNELGTCQGSTLCLSGQLVCQAKEAVPESCDGLDNDCDGETDEGFVDSDGDGTPDCVDADTDGDGVDDDVDNCPELANPGQADLDGDGIGDLCDDDDDGDGVPDGVDNCPVVLNVDQADSDGDGVGDACQDDDDGDGFPDAVDNCPDVPNVDQLDFDGDGVGDACDDDDDNDGVPDIVDNCDFVENVSQTDLDDDGLGDPCDPDDDNDGVPDGADNCPTVANDTQLDTDGDGMGDGCDPDDDGDGDPDFTDCGPTDPLINKNATEVCGNTVDEDCSGTFNDEGAVDCTLWYFDADSDGYGIDDAKCFCEPSGQYKGTEPGDCNDDQPGINPGEIEVCFNGIDDNCNSNENELNAIGCSDFWVDGDGDTYGTGTKQCFCQALPAIDLTATQGGDCADGDPAVNPGVAEICNNGKDDDCANGQDVEGSVGCTPHYFDGDVDGYGTALSKCLCGPQDLYSAPEPGDCNDSNNLIHPNAPEKCNGLDDDCTNVPDDAPITELCGALAHATAECLPSGTCSIVGCDPGYHNLNGGYTDGCECQEDAGETSGDGGDSCGGFLDVGTLNEGGTATRTGNIAGVGDSDWYHFRATDASPAGPGDSYYVRVRFTANPGGEFWLDVRRAGCGSTLCTEVTNFTWATDMNATPVFPGNGSPVATGSAPAGEGNCAPSPGLEGQNICNDDAEDYYVRVYRKVGAPVTCGSYTIEMTNAVFSTP